MALACEDETEISSTYTYIQIEEKLGTNFISDEGNHGSCDTGCCMLGCYCCSLLSVDLEPTRYLNFCEGGTPRSSLLSAHTILPLRPPIA